MNYKYRYYAIFGRLVENNKMLKRYKRDTLHGMYDRDILEPYLIDNNLNELYVKSTVKVNDNDKLNYSENGKEYLMRKQEYFNAITKKDPLNIQNSF